jgi:Tetratricopeptide repeat
MMADGADAPPGLQTICSTFILIRVVSANRPPSVEELCRRGIDLLAAGSPADAAEAFRTAISLGESLGGSMTPPHIEAHHGLIRALRDAGRLEQSIGAALALTALTPGDPLAHTALSISLQQAGHIPQAEAAATKARVLEWKIQLLSPPESQP